MSEMMQLQDLIENSRIREVRLEVDYRRSCREALSLIGSKSKHAEELATLAPTNGSGVEEKSVLLIPVRNGVPKQYWNQDRKCSTQEVRITDDELERFFKDYGLRSEDLHTAVAFGEEDNPVIGPGQPYGISFRDENEVKCRASFVWRWTHHSVRIGRREGRWLGNLWFLTSRVE